MKLALKETSPLWFAEIRFSTSAICLLIFSTIKRQLSYPHPTDIPVLISGSLLMMVGFTICIAFALRAMPAGRSVVLAYTSRFGFIPRLGFFLEKDRIYPSCRNAGGGEWNCGVGRTLGS